MCVIRCHVLTCVLFVSCVNMCVMCWHLCHLLSCVDMCVMCCHVLLVVSLPLLSDEVLDGQFQINDRTGRYMWLGLLVMCGLGVWVWVWSVGEWYEMLRGEYGVWSVVTPLFSSVLGSVYYSSGVGIHSFPPNGQLFAANLQDQGTILTYVHMYIRTYRVKYVASMLAPLNSDHLHWGRKSLGWSSLQF